jgi:NADH-quinone oxidoreductase subunit G
MQMFVSVIREDEAGHDPDRPLVQIAVMPCTAKKFEAARDEFKINGKPTVDYVITTQELIRMIKQAGIVFSELTPEAVDRPFGAISGAGVIFGVTGGVTEAVIRNISGDKSAAALMNISYQGIRGMEGLKTTGMMMGDRELKIAIASGLKNVSDLIERIENNEVQFDFVEVMACPGGCVCGGGRPAANPAERTKRGQGLYAADKLCSIKHSEENPLMASLYHGLPSGPVL